MLARLVCRPASSPAASFFAGAGGFVLPAPRPCFSLSLAPAKSLSTLHWQPHRRLATVAQPVASEAAPAPLTPEKAAFEAALKDPNPKFAVVQIGGLQYKVTPGDLILTNPIPAAINETIYLNKVLLVGSREETIIGTPLVMKASVMARVEEHTHTDKVYAFKKRRRKNSQRTRGIRHPVSALRIVSVESEGAPEAKSPDAK